jgi:transcriptional antiterminator RfaH
MIRPLDEPRSTPRWYAVHVRSNQERTTAAFLADREVELFFPTYRVISKRQDRRATVTKPLFAGYLFVHLNLGSPAKIEVLKAPGTVRIVGFGKAPTPVSDDTISSLRILVGNGDDRVRPHPLVKAGQRVEVNDGPFSGATGVLCEGEKDKEKFVVEIQFLGRAVSVPITKEQVVPIVG